MGKKHRIIKCFLYNIGFLAAKVYAYNLHRKIISLLEIFYSGWCASQMVCVGKNFKIGSNAYIKGQDMIYIYNNVFIGENVVMTVQKVENLKTIPKLEIGDNTMLGSNCHLSAIKGIRIGKNVRTGRNVLISDNSHGVPGAFSQLLIHPNKRPLYSKGQIIIDDNVWIGENVAVLGGVTIGCGAIVGANSVVTHDIPQFCIAAGCPAKIIKRVDKL